MESGGKGVKGFELEDVGLAVSVAFSLALKASVKQDATRCMESPRGVTTRLRWCTYRPASM